MNRRALLSGLTTSLAVLSGCLESGSSGGTDGSDGGTDGSGDDTSPTASPPDSPTESPPDSPTAGGTRLVEQSLTVDSVQCGNSFGETDVTIEGRTVTVDGTIDGKDSCYSARLGTVEYDESEDELRVTVESVSDADPDEVCQTCIVEIDYAARFEFEGGTPETVSVEHASR
jgi:hypothetical protein